MLKLLTPFRHAYLGDGPPALAATPAPLPQAPPVAPKPTGPVATPPPVDTAALERQQELDAARKAATDGLTIAQREGMPPGVTQAVTDVQDAIKALEAALTPQALATPAGKQASDKLAAALKEKIGKLADAVARSCDPDQGPALKERIDALGSGTPDQKTANEFADRALVHPGELKAVLLGPDNRVDTQKLAAYRRMVDAMDEPARQKATQALERAGLTLEVDTAGRDPLRDGHGKTLGYTSLDVSLKKSDPVKNEDGTQDARMTGTVSGKITYDANDVRARIIKCLAAHGITGDSIKVHVQYQNDPPPAAMKIQVYAQSDAIKAASWAAAAATGKATDMVDLASLSISTDKDGKVVLQGDGVLGAIMTGAQAAAGKEGAEIAAALLDATGFEGRLAGDKFIVTPRFTNNGDSPFPLPDVPIGGDARVHLDDVQIKKGHLEFKDGAMVFTFEAQARGQVVQGTGDTASHLPVPKEFSCHAEARLSRPDPGGPFPVEVDVRDGHVTVDIDKDDADAAQRFLKANNAGDVRAEGHVEVQVSGHAKVTGKDVHAAFAADVTGTGVKVDIKAQRAKAIQEMLKVAPEGEAKQALQAAANGNDPVALVKALRRVSAEYPVLKERVDQILQMKDINASANRGQVAVTGSVDRSSDGVVSASGKVTAAGEGIDFRSEDLQHDVTTFHLDDGQGSAAGAVKLSPTEQAKRLQGMQEAKTKWQGERERLAGEVRAKGEAIAAEAAKTLPDLDEIDRLLRQQAALERGFNATGGHIEKLDKAIKQQEAEMATRGQGGQDASATGVAAGRASGITHTSETEGEDGTKSKQKVHLDHGHGAAAGTAAVQSDKQGKDKDTTGVKGTAAGEGVGARGSTDTVGKDDKGNPVTQHKEWSADKVQAGVTGSASTGPQGKKVVASGQVSAEGVAVRQETTQVKTAVAKRDELTQKAINELRDDFYSTWDKVQNQLGPEVAKLYGRLSPEDIRTLKDALASKNAGALVEALQTVRKHNPAVGGDVDKILDVKVDRGLFHFDHSLRELQVRMEPKKQADESTAEHAARQASATEMGRDFGKTWDKLEEQLGPSIQGVMNRLPDGPAKTALRDALSNHDAKALVGALLQARQADPELSKQVEEIFMQKVDRGWIRADHSLRELQTLMNQGMIDETQVTASDTAVKAKDVTVSVGGVDLHQEKDGSYTLNVAGGRLTAEQIDYISRTLPDNIQPTTRSKLVEALKKVAASQMGVDGVNATFTNLSLKLDKDFNPRGMDMEVEAAVDHFKLPLSAPDANDPQKKPVVADIGRATVKSKFHMEFAEEADPKATPPKAAKPASFQLTGLKVSLDYQALARTYLETFGCKLGEFKAGKDGSVEADLTYTTGITGDVKAGISLSAKGDKVGLNVGHISIGNPVLAGLATVVPGLENWALQHFGLKYPEEFLGASATGDRGEELDMGAIGRRFISPGLAIHDVGLADDGKTFTIGADFSSPPPAKQ